MGLTVAVTGPTGEVGTSFITALEGAAGVDRILGMARRPFDPAARGWTRTRYRQGDVLDRGAVDALVAEADVVVHLAFLIMGSHAETSRVNLAGARNVFEATVAASRPARLVYTSSVAAYGYHPDNPVPLTEDVPTRGSSEHYYSRQKAESEALLREVMQWSDLDVYVLRPCIVAGPTATVLADSMAVEPGRRVGVVAGAHRSRHLTAAAAPVATSATLARTPWTPAVVEWVHVVRTSVVMDTGRARRELGWAARYTSQQALTAMAEAVAGRRPDGSST